MRFPRLFRAIPILAAVLVTVAAAGVATDASAQGWFTGASVGATKQYDYSVGDDPEASPDVSNSDDGGTGYRVYGGYLFHSNFGVMASYVDLGSATYSGPAWNGFTDKLDASGLDLSFLAGWAPGQQKRFTLFALAGVFFFKQDVQYVENVDDVPAAYNYEDSGMSFSYGVGAEIAIGSGAKWGVNFEYQKFMDVGDANESGHEYDRDLISAGVHYRFGK